MTSPFDPITLHTRYGDTAQVLAYGGHVTSWRTANGMEQLYLSPSSIFGNGVAIRGGVPIIFPQFSMEGPLPRHGFARTTHWVADTDDHHGDAARMTWVLRDDAYTRGIWPHAFVARYEVALGQNELTLTLQIENSGETELTFTSALHTYLHVGDIQQARIQGLRGVSYRDSAANGAMHTETEAQVSINGEVDHIYLQAPDTLTLHDGPERHVQLRQTGFNDIVVWNPGAQKCAALKDMPAEGYRHMLCIEAARIGQPVVLPAGDQWQGVQLLQLL